MIDPNKQYRTRDGRPVRIYATDGAGDYPIHGAVWLVKAWVPTFWTHEGRNISNAMLPAQEVLDLTEVTPADELTKQIPWEALRPEIQWVAMTACGNWYGYPGTTATGGPCKPTVHHGDIMYSQPYGMWRLEGVLMPRVNSDHWRETLCKRPENK